MRFLPFALIVFITPFTTSCDLFKPKDAAASAYDPYGQQTNPYGQAPATNPYGSYEPAQTTQPGPGSAYTAPATSGGGGGSITVKSGDTLSAIARRNNTSVSALRSANGLSGDLIKVGQRLNLP